MTDWDLDDVLAYTSYRRVRIRHKWVGGIYYLSMMVILAYTIGFQVILAKGYLLLQPIDGAVRGTVYAPRLLPALVDTPFCKDSGLQAPDGIQLPCVPLELLSDTRLTADIGLLVGTRVSSGMQTRTDCDPHTYGCTLWSPTTEELSDSLIPAFIRDVDNSTVFIQHSASAEDYTQTVTKAIDIVDTFSDPAVRDVEFMARSCETCPLESLPVNKTKGGDIIRLADLLSAAQIDLNEPLPPGSAISSHSPFHNKVNRRYTGTTVRISIVYETGGYKYVVEESDVQNKVETVRWENATMRMVDDIHGVQLVFHQTSKVYAFDVRTLILTLVSGFALMSVAKTVANSWVLYLSPDREKYRLFVETTTPDFDPDSEHERVVLARVLNKKRKKLKMMYEEEAGDASRDPSREYTRDAPLLNPTAP